MVIYFFLLLFSLFPTEAGAGFWKSCQPLFSRAEKAPLPPEERALWAKTFSGSHPYLPTANNDAYLFYYAYGKLPAPVRERLSALPKDSKLASEKVQNWVPELPPSSFLNQVLDRLRFRVGPNTLGSDHSAFEAKLSRDPDLQRNLELRFQDSVREAASRARWIQGETGGSQFPVRERGGKSFLVVGEKEIEFRAEGEGFLFLVPRENMANAAWNPVSQEKLGEMAEAGVKPPKFYRGGLGHNGLFYPDDGNHRLHLDTRKLIPVRMPSVRTLNLRLFFDYIGLPQPTAAKIRAYTEGKLAWEKLLPAPEHRRHFLVEPSNALP
jgi:hypothetical protein